jgi:hypothetical protein
MAAVASRSLSASNEAESDQACRNQVNAMWLPLSADFSIAAMIRCTATASAKLGAVRVPSRKSRAILA